MKSVKLQLLVTLAAVAAGFFIHRGPPPNRSWYEASWRLDPVELQRQIRWGADVRFGPSAGHTALHYATRYTDSYELQVRVASLLLDNGADVDARGGYEQTPLHEAIENAQFEYAEFLLDHGADPYAETDLRLSPLLMVETRESLATDPVERAKYVKFADLLRRHGARQ